MAAVLATHLAQVGEAALAAMMLESSQHIGAITPRSLDTAQRKLAPRRHGRAALPTPAWPEAPPPDEPNPIWRAVLAELRGALTPANYREWLAPTRVVAANAETLTVSVPSEFHARWLQARLAARVNGALARLGHEAIAITYVVGAGESGET